MQSSAWREWVSMARYVHTHNEKKHLYGLICLYIDPLTHKFVGRHTHTHCSVQFEFICCLIALQKHSESQSDYRSALRSIDKRSVWAKSSRVDMMSNIKWATESGTKATADSTTKSGVKSSVKPSVSCGGLVEEVKSSIIWGLSIDWQGCWVWPGA